MTQENGNGHTQKVFLLLSSVHCNIMFTWVSLNLSAPSQLSVSMLYSTYSTVLFNVATTKFRSYVTLFSVEAIHGYQLSTPAGLLHATVGTHAHPKFHGEKESFVVSRHGPWILEKGGVSKRGLKSEKIATGRGAFEDLWVSVCTHFTWSHPAGLTTSL